MEARHGFVSGRVQGVFYRQSARAQAQTLGLRGWVRNLDDGRVEVYALGTAAQLDAFRAWLAAGPPRARVAGMVWEAAPLESIAGFEVR
jgi:acylphosphatase